MKELLLFFEKDVFYEYKKHKLEEGYTIISIGEFLKDIANKQIVPNIMNLIIQHKLLIYLHLLQVIKNFNYSVNNF